MPERKVQVTIEITEAESIYLRTNCVLRVIKSAMEAVPDDYEYMADLEEAGPIFERLRGKIVNELFKLGI